MAAHTHTDTHRQTLRHTATDQRGSAGASAEWLVEGRAAQLQLLQITVGDSDVSRQRQALVEVLKHTQVNKCSNKTYCDLLFFSPFVQHFIYNTFLCMIKIMKVKKVKVCTNRSSSLPQKPLLLKRLAKVPPLIL